jgi:hypothetical protein
LEDALKIVKSEGLLKREAAHKWLTPIFSLLGRLRSGGSNSEASPSK